MHSTYPEENFGGFFFQKNSNSYFYSAFEGEQFVLWVKTFSSLLKIASDVSRRLLRVLYWFLPWILKISDFERNIFGIFGQISILPVRKFVGGQNVSEKNILLSLLSAHQAKDFHTSEQNLPAVLWNSSCTCPEEDFRRKSSWKKIAFNIDSQYQRKFLRLSANFCSTCSSQASFFIWRAVCWRQKMSEKKESLIIFFRILSGRISHFGKNCWDSLLKTPFYVPRVKLWRNFFQKSLNSYFFSDFERK